MATNTRIRNFRVPEDLWDEVRARAAVEDRTITAVVLRAIREYLANAPAPETAGVAPPRP